MAGPSIDALTVAAYEIPTDAPEADGTLEWDSTTLIVVRVRAGDERGLGYTYAHRAVAVLVQDKLAALVEGRDALDTPGAWAAMDRAVPNLGRQGLVANAVAAVDVALWDLKARLLGLPLATLLGQTRDRIPVYGSSGFTSYSPERLQQQLGDWVQQGIGRVKMKVGSQPDHDLERVRLARIAIGPETELFVDANGAYDRKQVLDFATAFAELGVSWFEEPVSSDDLEGLRRGTAGEVRFDTGSRALYSTDASNYRLVPIGVVVPRDVEDVEAACY